MITTPRALVQPESHLEAVPAPGLDEFAFHFAPHFTPEPALHLPGPDWPPDEW
jgi:hypothetical protein